MSTESLRTVVFQRYTQLQMWLLSRAVCYVVVLYLVTLVLFAFLRLFTGISIKRIGYFSLRHIVLTPKQGIEVRIGKLGIAPHRPTVARPGFLTFIVSNLEVVIDLNALIENDTEAEANGAAAANGGEKPGEKPGDSDEYSSSEEFESIEGISLLPKKYFRLFKLIRWMVLTIKVIDFQFFSVSLNFTDLMTIILTSLSLRVDLRKTKNYNVSNFIGTLDNYKLKNGEVPVNIRLGISDVYTAESLEDESPWHALEEQHFEALGVLNVEQMRVKQMGLQISCGQIHIDFAHLVEVLNNVKDIRSSKSAAHSKQAPSAGVQSENVDRRVLGDKDKKRIVGFSMVLLKLVHRIRISVGVGEILKVPVDNAYFAIRMRDLSLDISRMNSLSSGFRLFFDQGDMAHQSTFTVASLTAGIDKGNFQEEILYIPLVANLTRGNLFSQTLRFVKEDKRKNDSSVRTSWVFHAPNMSIEEHNIARLVNLFLNLKKRDKQQPGEPSSPTPSVYSDSGLPDQSILPKLDCDVTVHNPGFSLICDETEDCQKSMFVLRSSRVHMALKASHDVDAHSYSALATIESFGDQVYYNSESAKRVDIVNTESTSLTVKAVTAPEISVEISGKQSNLHVKALRHEIFCAIGQLHAAVRKPIIKRRYEDGDIPHEAIADGTATYSEHHFVDEDEEASELDERVRHGSAIRSLPSWLKKATFDLSDSSLLIATNKFRGQTNELFGIRVSSSHMGVRYETGLTSESIDEKKFKLLSDSDGRRLRVTGSDFNLYKADRNLLKHHERHTLTDQFSVAQLPSLNLMMLSHDEASVTVELNIEPRLYIDLNVNLILAFSVVQEIVDRTLLRHVKLPSDLFEKQEDSVKKGTGNQQPEVKHSHEQPKLKRKEAKYNDYHNVTVTMPRALIKIDLPSDDQVMFELGNTTVRKMATQNPRIKTKAFRLYSQHPFKRTSWCILASMQNLDAVYALDTKASDDDKIKLDVKAIRINVPYEFKLYRIIDNGITLAKSIKTLITQTKNVDWMEVLDTKKIEGVPKIPRTRIKTQQLQLSLEDDYFESDLNLIMLTNEVVSKLRMRKIYSYDTRIKEMLREGLKQLENMEAAPPSKSNSEVNEKKPPKENDLQHQDHEYLNGAEEKAHERLHQATGAFKRAATQVFEHNHDQRSARTSSDSQRIHWQPLAFALRNVSRQKIELLLATGIELGCPENDNDPVFTDHHVWLDFWGSSEFKDFRKLKVIMQDGNPGRMSINESRLALLQDLSNTWIECIKRERMIQHLGAKKRRTEILQDNFHPDTCAEESIIDYSQKPLLMSVDFRQLDMVIAQTTHNTPEKLHNYIHEIGKGQPKDTNYSILIPLFIDIRAHGGLKVELRDYPLPIMHFPGLARSQDPNTNLALQITGDLIITEQLMTSSHNIRKIFVPLRPMLGDINERSSDVIEVHRTLTPIKTFTNLKFHAGSTIPTRVSWCMAYKPGFHGVGEAFHGFSKPPIDPSPSLGFWDKIRLVLHARFDFELPKSPLCLCIKAGKSPYALLDDSSGFVFAWKDNVKVEINADDDPKNLFNFRSDGFELSVPDYMEWEKEFLRASPGQRALPRAPASEKAPTPEKVVFSFDQRTVWQLGMMFEKGTNVTDESGALIKRRDTNFRDHYDVELCMPDYIDDIESYDAYEGFKSEFMYMAISVVSRPGISVDGTVPHEAEFGQNHADTDALPTSDKANKCACHLSLGVLRHFKFWKDQFKGEQWPPIKTGSLFPDPVRVRPANVTFGSALSSVQYQIALSPLDLSFFHQMRHHNAAQSHDRCTGLKAKIEEFVFDWHTRREPPLVEDENGNKHHELAGHRRWRMKSHKGEVRVSSVQMRVIDATLRTQSSKQALNALHYEDTSDDEDDPFSEASSSTGESSTYRTGSRTGMSGQGTSYMNSSHYGPKYLGHSHWIDLDDYTDVGRRRTLRSKVPDVRVLPFLYTPMFYYIRNTDFSGRAVYVDPKENRKVQKFGDVLVHQCMISGKQPERCQMELLRLRRNYIGERLSDLKDSLESLENQGAHTQEVQQRISDLQKYIKVGNYNLSVLKEEESRLDHMASTAETQFRKMSVAMEQDLKSQMCISHEDEAEDVKQYLTQEPEIDLEFGSDGANYRNRYIIYAVHLRWNNSVRNLIFRLQSTLSEDKELDYVRCRRAVQYLEELVSHTEGLGSGNDEAESATNGEAGGDEAEQSSKGPVCRALTRSKKTRQENLEGNSDDAPRFKESYQEDAHEKLDECPVSDPYGDGCKIRLKTLFDDLSQVSEEEIAEKSHLVSFLTPRIQLVAEDNPSKCVQVIARDIETHIIDTYRRSAPIDVESANVERRFGILLNKSSIFVLGEEDVQHPCIDSLCLECYSGEEEMNQRSWPPWLALELCYDSMPLRRFAMLQDVSFGVKLNKPNDLHVVSQREEEEERSSSSSDSGEGTDESPEKKANGKSDAAAADLAEQEAEKFSKDDSGHHSENGEADPENNAGGSAAMKAKFGKTLKHHGEHKGEALVTSIVIDAPKLVINIDSVQFFTIYAILVDLFTYRDPLIKQRQQAIDRAFLSNDFQGDFRATLRRIELLQKDISTMLTLSRRLQLLSNSSENSREIKIHMIQLEREAIRRMTQLTVLIRAFKASLRQRMNTGTDKFTKLSLLADSVRFRMLSETGDPTIELFLRRVHYARLSHEDAGSLNRATLAGILARNLLPDSTYPLILANYELEKYGKGDANAVKVKWASLDHVGGIPVLDDTEVKLKPLHIQLEHGIFEKILDFAFPINQYSGSKDEARRSTSSDRSNAEGSTLGDDESSNSDSDISITLSMIDRDESDTATGSSSPYKPKPRKSKARKNGFLRKLMKRKDSKDSRLDVDEMMDRASNYWSIRFLKVHPTQLTVSYKAKKHYNLLNLQNLHLPMPALEIRNKTCTKLDLVMRLKRMAIKVLVSQSGSILTNRFKKHKVHTIDDERDLNLDVLSRKFSRRSSEVSTVTDGRSHWRVGDAEEDSLLHDNSLHFLQPLHRQKAQADPENARKLIWEAISEGNSNSSYKTGELRGNGPTEERFPRSSMQSRRTSSQRPREPSGSPRADPGSPRQLRQQGAGAVEPSQVSRPRSDGLKHAFHLKHHNTNNTKRPPNQPKHSSSFIEKLKKGFNDL